MALDIGASGFLGLAFETVLGTYVAPTKYMPIRNETLHVTQENFKRRSIRGIADMHGVIGGNITVEGDIEFEVLEDRLPYFLHCSRNSVVKSGAINFSYTYTPTHLASGAMTKSGLSLTVVRNGIVFGYLGCWVTSMEFSIDTGVLICKIHVMGMDEIVQSAPTATWPTAVPFGAGQYTMTIGGSVVTDMDAFTITIEDNGEAIHRLRSTGRGPVANIFKERAVSISTDRDFQNRTDYDAFKALTAQDWIMLAAKNVNNSVQVKCAVAIKDSYDINLSGQGDLLRGSITYDGVFDPATSKSYEIVVKTQEDIV